MFYKKAILKRKDFELIGCDYLIDSGWCPTRKDKHFRVHGWDNKVNQNLKSEMKRNRQRLKQFEHRVRPSVIKKVLGNRWNWD